MIPEVKKIIIDPRSRINYAAYYIKGFVSLFGWNRIKFERIEISEVDNMYDYYRGCAIVLEVAEGAPKRIYIDPHDSDIVLPHFYDWADVYAKINVRPEDTDREKLLVIGPNFGIRLWNPIKTMWMAFVNSIMCYWGRSGNVPLKSYLLDYVYTFYRRRSISEYENAEAQECRDYVFALSTLWYDPQTYSTTNRFRGVFAKSCKKVYPRFEGGFFYIPSDDVVRQFPQYREYLNEYKDMLITKRIGLRQYLQKTMQSAIVFNTPSVLGCHGWKLGEYLAMGKAIISTPLNNLMPGDFKEGVHYVSVNNESDIVKAVEKLRMDESLRKVLKKNARLYYEEYLAPESVVKRIIDRC